jgi:hypothetical protein
MNSEMKGWKSYLLWEGLPFLMLFGLFGLVSAVNWDYERKLITPFAGSPDWIEVYMGPIMLAAALVEASVASVILFIVRISRPKKSGPWSMFVSLTITAIFLIFPSLFIVILGPAMISIVESMQQVPGK